MPRDIGPDMLRNIDDQLRAGRIDQARYDARRVEIMELIRRGKAVEYSRTEHILRVISGLLSIALGVIVFSFGPNVIGGLIALALIVFGVMKLTRS